MGTITGRWEKPQTPAPECDMVIHSCGRQTFESERHTNRPEGRPDYQLIYIYRGKGHFELAQEWAVVTEGCFLLYAPGETQRYAYYPQDDVEVYYSHFSGKAADKLLQSAGLTGGAVYHIGVNDKFSALFEKIIHELQTKPALYRQTSVAVFTQWIACAARQIERKKNTVTESVYDRITDLVDYIHRNFHQNTTIAQYARICGLSKYYFLHCFRQITHSSPIAYRNRIRVEKAKEMLEETNLTVSEISAALGFESASYFSRVFKKQEGVAPLFYP